MKQSARGEAIQAILVECLAAGQARGLTAGGEAKAIEPFYHQLVDVLEGAEKTAKKAGVHKAEAAAEKVAVAAAEEVAEAERQAKADREAAERRRDGQSHTNRPRRW